LSSSSWKVSTFQVRGLFCEPQEKGPRVAAIAIGLTTKVAVAQLGTDNPLALPRLDTNDLPT